MTDHSRRERSSEARLADHAAIERLADELLPALVARLGATGLGELEVREDEWRVRLRRPASDRRLPAGGRGAPGRAGRPDDGRPGEGTRGDGRTDPAARERPGGGPPGAASHDDRPAAASGSEALPPLTSVLMEPAADVAVHGPIVATSPAVGIYRARTEGRTGGAVRAGDRLATVDMLGVPHEVLAPADGIVSAALVDDGDAVEYGQVLLALEPLPASGERGGAADRDGAGDRGSERGGGAS